MLLTKTKVAPGSSSTSATRSSIAARSWSVLLTRRKDSRSSARGSGGGAAGRRAGATLVARLGRSLLSRAPKRPAGCALVASLSAVATMENA